jgi:predicted nuclease of predicted toxin-antitoxin system
MKFLLDTCVPRDATLSLREAGYDVVWLLEGGTDPGDEAILTMALQGDRILVTSDKDFGELAVRLGLPHGPIIRLRRIRVGGAGSRLLEFVSENSSILIGAILVVLEPDRFRIRRSA